MRIRHASFALGFFPMVVVHSACADQGTTTKYVVMRNDSQIGTNTVSVAENGPRKTVQTVTHVEVKFGFVTLYRFDQTETEQWVNGKLLAMNATTNDNGTLRRTDLSSVDGRVTVECGGPPKHIATAALPFSLWNPALLAQTEAIDPRDGSLVSVSVADRGEDNLVIQGRTTRAHHYIVTTTFAQDVWYDSDDRLVRVQLKGRDGSTILYQLG